MTAALLFSGGLDSVCATHLLADAVPVYVTLGHKYEAAELAVAYRLAHGLRVLPGPAIGHLEEPDGHIRHRNAAIVTTVAAHGWRTIYIGALRGEGSPDKSPAFMRVMARLLTVSEAEAHTVLAPFAHLTKTELLRRALAAGMPAEVALQSRSCYGAALDPCAACQACFRRWVALTNNGLDAGYLPDLPSTAGIWHHLRRAGLVRLRDVLANNVDAARAILRAYA